MRKPLGQRGAANTLLVPVILLSLLFIVAAIFAVWAFGGRQDYKDNVDAKVQTAVAANTKSVQAADASQYAEAAKSPLKTYVGPDDYGSIHLSYPKTWSAYIDTTESDTPIDAYFHSDVVPSTDDNNAVYDLRLQVVSESYDSELSDIDSNSDSSITATPYSLPLVPKVIGTMLTGQVLQNLSQSDSAQSANGTVVVLPIRNETLLVWTETASGAADFTKYILPNLSFSP